MALGDIARKAPPPSKLPKGPPVERDEMGAEGEDESGDDEAAALGLMESFLSAVKGGDAQEALTAYRNLKDGC